MWLTDLLMALSGLLEAPSLGPRIQPILRKVSEYQKWVQILLLLTYSIVTTTTNDIL